MQNIIVDLRLKVGYMMDDHDDGPDKVLTGVNGRLKYNWESGELSNSTP